MQNLVMELLRITPLKKNVPEFFSPSRLSWILKCPLRARFEGPDNACYKVSGHENYPAMMGNVIHKVLEQSNLGRIRNDEDFEHYWVKFEQGESPGGLKGKVKNYGSFKFLLGRQAVRNFPDSMGLVRKFKSPVEKEYSCTDIGIKGRPDLVVFKRGLPYEIKDYKTGNIFEHAENGLADGEDSYELIKEDYRQQLLTYALLIYSNFTHYPQRLSIVNFPRQEISTEFDYEDAAVLRSSILKMRKDIQHLDDSQLAKPLALNCRFCIYRPGCQFASTDEDYHLQDLEGIVKSVQKPEAGNFILVLEGDRKVFFRDNAEGIPLENLNIGAKVYLSKLFKRESPKDFWVFSKLSNIYLLEGF